MDTSRIIAKVKTCIYALKAEGNATKTTAQTETVVQCLGAVIGDLELLSVEKTAVSVIDAGDNAARDPGAMAGDGPGSSLTLKEIAAIQDQQKPESGRNIGESAEMPKIANKSGKRGKSRNYINGV